MSGFGPGSEIPGPEIPGLECLPELGGWFGPGEQESKAVGLAQDQDKAAGLAHG